MDISIYYRSYILSLSIRQSNTVCYCSIEAREPVPDFDVYDLLSILKRNKISNGIKYENLKLCCERVRRGEDVTNVLLAKGRLPIYTRRSVNMKVDEIVHSSVTKRSYFGPVKAGQVLATGGENLVEIDGYTLDGRALSASQCFKHMAGNGVTVDFERKEYRAECDGHAYMQSNVLIVKDKKEAAKPDAVKRDNTNYLLLLSEFIDTKSKLN